MIRDRRREDLPLLDAVLIALDVPPGADAEERERWLAGHDVHRSWVYDMAPVSVAPTRNVVGHVQHYRPAPELADACLADAARSREDAVSTEDAVAGQLVAIGKLVVRPERHAYGIARYLLKQSVSYVRSGGGLPVLDLHDNAFRVEGFYERCGFTAVPSTDPRLAPMVLHPRIADKRHYVRSQ